MEQISTVKRNKYTVVPVYHPGPRAATYRSIAEQKGDLSFLGEILRLSEPF
jgi:hypothetical protein